MRLKKLPEQHWLRPMLLPFYLPLLLTTIAETMLIPTLPLFLRDLGANYAVIGMVLSGMAVGTLIGDIPAGILARKLGGRRMMLVGLVLIAASTVLLFWAHSLAQVFLYRLVNGFGFALYGLAPHAYTARFVPGPSRGKANSLFGGVFRLGGFIGPVLGGFIAASWNLRVPFLVYGGICGAGLISILSFYPQIELEITEQVSSLKKVFSTLKTHRHAFLTAGVACLFLMIVRSGRQVLLPLYSADMIGLDISAIGVIVSIGSAIDTLLFLPTGFLVDRLGRKFAAVPCTALLGVGFALMPITHNFIGLLLVSILIGFGNGLGAGIVLTLGADFSPKSGPEEFLGLWRLIADIGGSGGPLAVGWAANLLTLPYAALVVSGFGFLASLFFLFLVPETLKRKIPERQIEKAVEV
jgi:MFS family permease